jgi:glycerophosphoryl diester phosphodiesterase
MDLSELNNPVIIAHRGASAYAPENTLKAFQLAIRQKADAVELDAKLTKDGYVVVIHDQNVERTTNGKGRVKDLTLAEIRKLEAGSHFDISFAGEPVPTLDEVLETIGEKIFINIELTNYASPLDELPEKVAESVKRNHVSQNVFFSSFNPINLARIQRLIPEAACGLLALGGWKGAFSRSLLGRLPRYQSINAEVSDVTLNLIQKAHQRNQKVFVYTVNQKEIMEQLFILQVDGIFTDDPIAARQVLNKLQRKSEI